MAPSLCSAIQKPRAVAMFRPDASAASWALHGQSCMARISLATVRWFSLRGALRVMLLLSLVAVGWP